MPRRKRTVLKVKHKRKINFQANHILIIIFFIFSLSIIYKLYFLQIVNGEYYKEIADAQNKGFFISKLIKRGDIYFKSNNLFVPVATQKIQYLLAINPKIIKKPKSVLKLFKKIEPLIDEKKFWKAVAKKNDPYEIIFQYLDEEQAQQILKERYKGVVLEKQSKRYYPFNKTASTIIGFINYQQQGAYGLEKFYDNILRRGEVENRSKLFDLFFDKPLFADTFAHKKVEREGDIYASIDINAQKKIEEIVNLINKKYHSQFTGAVAIKPQTGAIIAMADTKAFNLNKNKKDFSNYFIERRYEFGSIFKPFLISTGLELGKIDLSFKYNDTGCQTISNYHICNFRQKSWGKDTPLKNILIYSLNMGTVAVEKKIGHKNLLDFLAKIGIEEEVGIDFPGEIASDISSLHNIRSNIDFATASYGQGIAFTPISVLRFFSAIANGGYMVNPHFIWNIKYGDLIPEEKFKPEKKQIFKKHIVDSVRDILVERSDKLDYRFFDKRYSFAVKTGTAQIAYKGKYAENKTMQTMIGFFPANAPEKDRILLMLFTIAPDSEYAAKTLKPYYYQIADYLIQYFNLKPDRLK